MDVNVDNDKKVAKEKYDKTFVQCWKDLKNNPILFVPNLLMFFSTLVLVFIFFSLSGVISYLQNQPIFFREVPITSLFVDAPLKIAAFFLMYLVFEFLISSYLLGMKFGMAKEVIEKSKTSLKTGFKYANSYFFKVLGLEVLILAIVFAPLIIFSVFAYFSYFTENITGNFFLVMFILLFVIYFFYMIFNFVFVYPVMFFERKIPTMTIKREFHYVKHHFVHTLISWLIIIGMMLYMYVVKLPFDRIVDYSSNLVFVIIAFLLIYLLSIIFYNWEHLFVMRAYLQGKKQIEVDKKQ